MKKLRKLSRLLDDFEDAGVDPEDIVIDPKSVHIVSDDEVKVVETEDED